MGEFQSSRRGIVGAHKPERRFNSQRRAATAGLTVNLLFGEDSGHHRG
jgi:hypothetical protein